MRRQLSVCFIGHEDQLADCHTKRLSSSHLAFLLYKLSVVSHRCTWGGGGPSAVSYE